MDNKESTIIPEQIDEKKIMKKVLNLDGEEYVKMMSILYDKLDKDLLKIDNERNEVVKGIKDVFNQKREFVEKAWADKNITKKEKQQIYNVYMEASKAFNQYLMDKEGNIEKRKNRKELFKDISLGTLVFSVSISAVCFAVKGVLEVYDSIKALK